MPILENGDVRVEIDTARVKSGSDGIMVWIRSTYRTRQRTPSGLRYQRTLDETYFDCSQARTALLSYVLYDASGNLVRSLDVTDDAPHWEDVVPDSRGEATQRAVCRVLSAHIPRSEPAVAAAMPTSVTPISDNQTYFEFQVEKQAATVPGSLSANYPEMLKSSGGDGKATAQFVVDTTGRADMSTWKVLESTNDLFAEAARGAVRNARFYPAEIAGRKVRQLTQLPFTFNRSK